MTRKQRIAAEVALKSLAKLAADLVNAKARADEGAARYVPGPDPFGGKMAYRVGALEVIATGAGAELDSTVRHLAMRLGVDLSGVA